MNKFNTFVRVNRSLKELIGYYPEDHLIAGELEKTQRHILGLMLSDRTGTPSLDSALSEGFGVVLSIIPEARIKRALECLGQRGIEISKKRAIPKYGSDCEKYDKVITKLGKGTVLDCENGKITLLIQGDITTFDEKKFWSLMV